MKSALFVLNQATCAKHLTSRTKYRMQKISTTKKGNCLESGLGIGKVFKAESSRYCGSVASTEFPTKIRMKLICMKKKIFAGQLIPSYAKQLTAIVTLSLSTHCQLDTDNNLFVELNKLKWKY